MNHGGSYRHATHAPCWCCGPYRPLAPEDMLMGTFDSVDFFTDLSLVNDPCPYFDHLRSKGPLTRLPHRSVVAVTGHEEATAILNDAQTFSSAVAVGGPIPDLPFAPEGDDIRARIEEYREQLSGYGAVVTMDGARHARHRSLLMRLFTPSRLKKSEEFIWSQAGKQIDEFIDKGRFELLKDYASPYAMLVIADLLGVPEEDRKTFREQAFSVPQIRQSERVPAGTSECPRASGVRARCVHLRRRRACSCRGACESRSPARSHVGYPHFGSASWPWRAAMLRVRDGLHPARTQAAAS